MTTKYQQIARQIKDAIDRHEIKPGEKIPSALNLRKQYGISHITAMNVYQHLMDSNYIENFSGRGYFVKKSEELKQNTQACSIGLCIRALWDYNLSDVYFNEITYGIQQECIRHRYSWQQHFSSQTLNHIPFNYQNAAEIKQGFMYLADKVDGFLVDERIPDDLLAELMLEIRKPMVLINRHSKLKNIDTVLPAVDRELLMALELAQRLSYRNFILAVSEKYQENSLLDIVRGTFDHFMHSRGVSPGHIAVIRNCNLVSYSQTVAEVKDVLAAMPEGKTLIISDMAFALYRATRALNNIPGILSVKDTWENRAADMELTALQLKPIETGSMAVRQILKRIRGTAEPYAAHSPKAELVIGKTL